MSLPSLNSPSRILIIKPSAIGDVVHTLPILNLLRNRWPAAHIAWLVTPTCSGLLERHPQLDEVIPFERKRFGQSWRSPKTLLDLHAFTKALRKRQFDWVIDLQGLFRSGWLAFKTRAPVRIGFRDARELAPIFYTHRIDVDRRPQHAIERYLSLAQAAGCSRAPVEFRFAVDDADRHVVSELMPAKRYAVLLPGTNWATKRWPAEKFAALVKPLRERFDLATVVAGGPDAAPMAAAMPEATNLVGRTNLRQLVALLEGAALVVANDSGPMHIAAALSRPLATPYGPTSPVLTGPYGRMDSVLRLDLPCSPCFSRKCSHQSCLRWLEIEPVLHWAERQMNERATAGVSLAVVS